jgi:hypothetical protein
MSVSFYYDTMPRVEKFNACYVCEMPNSTQWNNLSEEEYLNVQDAFSKAVIYEDDSDAVKSLLQRIARPECTLCHGQGWFYRDELQPSINWSNSNAAAILSVMGYTGDQLYGAEVPISDFRRAFIKAINSDVSKYERPDHIEYGQPREIEDGIIEMKPIRFMSAGLPRSGILDRLDRLGEFIAEAISNKANTIYWQ